MSVTVTLRNLTTERAQQRIQATLVDTQGRKTRLGRSRLQTVLPNHSRNTQ